MRRWPVALLTIASFVVVFVAPAAPAGADTIPPVGVWVGVNPGSVMLWEPDAERQDELDAIVATGARWISIDIDWNSVQPDGPDGYDWTVTDRVVREAHVRDLAIIGMVAYAPPWARPDSCPGGSSHCLPERPEDYARFAKAAALRYGANAYDESLRGAIGTWQVWNEPNHAPFVQPRVDVARYTELLRRAYGEIKKVDRRSVVLAAGTAPAPDDSSGRAMAPVTFLEGIYSHGGGDAFDAFAHHPYSYPCSPLINKEWNAFFQTYWLHQALVRHGDGDRTIWGTESGAPTGDDVGGCGDHDGVSVSEADQARFAVDALRGWTQTFGRFTGPLLWYQIRDASSDPARASDHFGLVRRDFGPKPALGAFTAFLAGPDLTVATPAPVPAPDPVPDPSPPPDPPPTDPPPVDPGGECQTAAPDLRLYGEQTDRVTPGFDAPAVVDARTARWTQVDPWPVSVTGAGSVCWSGGTIVGTYPVTTTWDEFHSTGAFNVANPDSVVENVRIHDYGDGIRLRDAARNWRIRGAYLTDLHDDCIEDDKLHAGVITDSLLDGCYVGISTRPTASDGSSDGRRNTLVLDGSLLRLQPMPTVYKGAAPGHGGFFKWDTDAGRSPRLVVRNDVFRVDQEPNHGTLAPPAGYDIECSGNTIVWLGDGPFPAASAWRDACPDTRIVTSRSVWDDAVTAWHVAHAR